MSSSINATMEPPPGIKYVAASCQDTSSYLLRSDGAVDRTRGAGEKKTLRIVARNADYWHSFVGPDDLPRKISIIEDWAARDGGDASRLVVSNEIARRSDEEVDALFDSGVRLFTLALRGPDFDWASVERWLRWRDERNAAGA